MSRGTVWGRIGLLLVLLAFAGGVFWVFGLQFRGGMTYPEGSTLRADARGAMILYESLEAMPALRTRRLLDPLHRLETDPERVTLVVLNADRNLVRYKPLIEFVQSGGRVLLQPRAESERRRQKDEESEKDEDSGEEPLPLIVDLESEDDFVEPDTSLAPHLRVRSRRMPEDGVAVRAFSDLSAPVRVAWPEGRVFERGGMREEVEILYAGRAGAVVLGALEEKGEWLFLSDNLTVLNQVMFGEAQTEWLIWCLTGSVAGSADATVGGRTDVVFWEYPMGIRQPRGIMTLIRQYRLTPVIGILGLVFLLWVWQGSVPLLPVLGEHEEPDVGAQSRLDGLRDLLRRYVPVHAILSRCLEEWRADLSRTAAKPERLAPLWETADRRANAALPKRNRAEHVRERYLFLHEHLNPKRSKR